MYGLDLFSGIGGITKALEGYVQPVAYCENDRYAQAVLLSRMRAGDLPHAPIWDDVCTLHGTLGLADVIYGGFPCQDISLAGRGEGLDGKRSGLFFEVARLIGEIRPRFVFLENVSAITVRGAERVVGELCRLGYDSRWGILSASDVGAYHERERWWLLAHTSSAVSTRLPIGAETSHAESRVAGEVANTRCEHGQEGPEVKGTVRGMPENRKARNHSKRPSGAFSNASSIGTQWSQQENGEGRRSRVGRSRSDVPHAGGARLEGWSGSKTARTPLRKSSDNYQPVRWWEPEPHVGRVAHGVPLRVDRLRGLGNAVVPAQAREAFERLMGLKDATGRIPNGA